MEAVLLWCLAYAIYRSIADTAANTAHLLLGQPVTPRGRRATTEPGVPVRRAYLGRSLGAIFGLARESFIDGWYAGWAWGRQAYRSRGSRWSSWRPWSQPPAGPEAAPGPPRDSGAGQPGPKARPGRASTQAPTIDPADPQPESVVHDDEDYLDFATAGDSTEPPPTRPRPEPASATPSSPSTSAPPAAGSQDEEILDGHPVCWTDLDAAEQAAVAAAARDQWGRLWLDLTVDQCAAAVADWINATFGVALTPGDVIAAQARHDDPTWLTGPVPSAGTAEVAALPPAPSVAGTTTPQGDTMITSGETTNIENTRTYYTNLQTHVINDIASQIELSRSYLTAAQMEDQNVLDAISAAEEAAHNLAAAAGGVLTALANHRLMEEAVASTPGAAATDFYRS